MGRTCAWSLGVALVVVGCGSGSSVETPAVSDGGETSDTARAVDGSVDSSGPDDDATPVDASIDTLVAPIDSGTTSPLGCPATGFTRLVSVSTDAQLAAAFSGAKPGDQIRLASGTYGERTLSASGTASARIVVCALPGVWPKLRHFELRGSYVTMTGLVFEGPNGDKNNIWIDGPHDVDFSGNEVRSGTGNAGISIENTYNVSVTRNYIHDNGVGDIDHGIYYRHQAGKGNVIANNVIANNFARGISMHDNGGGAISDATVVNNTIVRNGGTGIQIAVNAGTGDVVANNVLSENGWREGLRQIRVINGSSNLIANNVVWSSDASRLGIADQTTTNTLTGNLEKDPLFVTAYSDLHLKTGSPAIGAALSTKSPSGDFDGKSRDGAPDIGAFEH